MNWKKEIPLIVIVALPFLYLAYIWQQLPERVPIHWNISGEIDRYENKIVLILLPILLPLLTYLIFLVVPKIDPKSKLQQMGGKLQSIKFLLTVFMSILALFILHSVKTQSLGNPNYILLSIGVLYIILGNYFKTLKPNYFIGIRTPWTLESENVWKETHKLGGKIWFVGGIVVVVSSLLLPETPNLTVFFIITGIIAIIPMVYSYIIFQKEKKNKEVIK